MSTTIPDTPEASKRKPQIRWGCCLFIVAVLIVGVMFWRAVSQDFDWKRYEKESVARQIADIKASKTSCLYSNDPEFLDAVVQDTECAEKITEVVIFGDFVPDICDVRFQTLRQLPQLKAITLEYLGCVDGFLENIQGMASLEKLSFHRAGVSRKGMRLITGFPKLKRLSIDDRTDLACLDELKDRPGIESLGLYEYKTTADRLGILRSLPDLRELTLELELDGGVLDLRGLNRLEKLTLSGCMVTDAALANLQQIESLTDLYLEGRNITDAGLVHLRDHPKLRRLSLRWQPITDKGLSELYGLTSLESLTLCATKVTDQGVKRLQQALPKCKIER